MQASWVKATLPQLAESERIGGLRLPLADGSQVSGADVYRHVMRRIWWAYPFYGLSVAPVLSGIFDGAYRTFARNRYRVSRACRLPESLASAPPWLPDGQGSETDDPGCRTTG